MAVCSKKFAVYSNCCDGRSEISALIMVQRTLIKILHEGLMNIAPEPFGEKLNSNVG
jgi:hypothetical protein